jgi:spoIIIJ-associated protein
MRFVEKTGRSVEEAVDAALEELGVTRDEVEVEVLEKARGFLGIFAREGAAVRVTVRADTGEGPEEAGEVPTGATKVGETGEVVAEAIESEEPGEAPVGPLTELAEEAKAAVIDILGLMGVDAAAEVKSVDDESVHIDLAGADVALLIGRHGDTLDALQLLTALISTRQSGQRGRIVLDAENYRERRCQMLENMARSRAQEAKRTRQEVVLLDLKPYERRIIHMALMDDPEVSTYSEGEGAGRRLVISPTE